MEVDYQTLYLILNLDPIESRGSEDRFQCPDLQGLHANGDTNGKLHINREKNVYNCWVCGGGRFTQLVAAIKNITEDEAKKWLSQFSRDEEDHDVFLKRLEKLFETPAPSVSTLPYFNPALLECWDTDHPFFQERGISEAMRQKFRCGYNAEEDAIVFPHFWKGRLVGYQQRNLSSEPKYQFTSDFPRRETIWGLSEASSHPFVVESIPTALRLFSEGYTAVATFGASIGEAQLKHLRRFTDGIIIAADNDKPGQKFSKLIWDALSQYIPIYSVGLVGGDGSDLGDLPLGTLNDHILSTLGMMISPDLTIGAAL